MMVEYQNNGVRSSSNNDKVDIEMWLSQLRTFAGLTSVMLLVGLLANAYLLRVTVRRRYPVHWDTFRLILRYTSVVDLSLCFVLASVILLPSMFVHIGSDVIVTLRCTRFHIEPVSHCGLLLAGSGVIVVCRQVCALYTFKSETALVHQHSDRVMKLVRDVVVVSVVCLIVALLTDTFGPEIDLQLCLVVGTMTSRAVYLLLFPIVVSVVLGGVVVAPASRPEVDIERLHLTTTSEIDKSTVVLENEPIETTHPRRKRFVIVVSVSVLSWFVLAAGMASAGVLMRPISVGTILATVGCSAMDSTWSAYAVYRHWV